MTRNRRSFMTTLTAIGTVGVAGCLSSVPGLSDDDGTTGEPSDNDDGSEHLDLPGESIEQFETLDGWVSMLDAGSIEGTDDDPYVGSQSARLYADEETEYAATYRTYSDLDLTDRTLSLAVNFTGREQLHLTLELYAPNARNAVTMERTLTGPADRWVRVDFGTTDVAGDPDLSSVDEIRIIARRRGDTDGSIDCRIDDLRIVDRPDRGRVMFLFDGTLEDHHATAFEQMQAYGFAGTEAVIREAVGETGRLSLPQLDELADAGWDMISRPRTGAQALHDMSPEQQEGAIRQNKAYLENYGFEEGAQYFLTPRNVLGTETIDLVREYHEGAFRYGGAPTGAPQTDPHNAGFFSGADGLTTTNLVDHAADHGQLAVLHFEHVGDDGISESSFEAVLEHVDAADVDVVTATELTEGY